MTTVRVSWKRERSKMYTCTTPNHTQAFIFAAPSRVQLWAWAVYWHGGSARYVEHTFAAARRAAEAKIREAEGAKAA